MVCHRFGNSWHVLNFASEKRLQFFKGREGEELSDIVVGYVDNNVIILHAMSCGRYNVFDPSVSQSVSPVFLISATPLKLLDRIS